MIPLPGSKSPQISERTKDVEPQDYRNSHKSKGADYDETILSAPFDLYMDKWEAHHLGQILDRLCPEKIPRYLDFACGTGRITQRIELRSSEAIGVDVSESMLNIARQKCRNTRFLCVDVTRNSCDLGLFDLVTSFRFFGNAQDELRAAALEAINRLLRPGGYLIINNHRNPHSLLGYMGRLSSGRSEMDLSHTKLKNLIYQHGFEIVHQRAIGFWIFRFKLTDRAHLGSPVASMLESLFQYSCFVPFSPDSMLVARKIA